MENQSIKEEMSPRFFSAAQILSRLWSGVSVDELTVTSGTRGGS